MKLRIVFAIRLVYWVLFDPTFDPANVSLSANSNFATVNSLPISSLELRGDDI